MKETGTQDAQTAAILDAAATVFAEHGFAGARVEAIAKAAGLNKAMLYYRLGDKARLYELTILGQFDRVSRAMKGVAGIPAPGANPVEGLLEAMAALFREDPRLPRIMAWEFASGGNTMPETVVSRWAEIIGLVAPFAVRLGMHPALLWLALLGPMVLTCLTAPIRSRLGDGLPEPMRGMVRFDVDDMAGFLSQLFQKASGGNL